MNRQFPSLILLFLVFLVLGTTLVWQGNAHAKILEVTLDQTTKGGTAVARSGQIAVRLYYEIKTGAELGWENEEARIRVPMIEVRRLNRRVMIMQGEVSGFAWPTATAQILELDPGNPYPEVLLSTYSGGAHCCTVIRVASASPEGSRWYRLEAGPFDGDRATVSDEDGDGVYEFSSPDQRFHYQFSSYAGSYPPMRIQQVRGRKLVDVSSEPAFQSVHRNHLNALLPIEETIKTASEPNGILAGYTATRARLGEFEEAWRTLLALYDRKSEWGLRYCSGGYDAGSTCLKWSEYPGYPTALLAFLRKTGYVDPE